MRSIKETSLLYTQSTLFNHLRTAHGHKWRLDCRLVNWELYLQTHLPLHHDSPVQRWLNYRRHNNLPIDLTSYPHPEILLTPSFGVPNRSQEDWTHRFPSHVPWPPTGSSWPLVVSVWTGNQAWLNRNASLAKSRDAILKSSYWISKKAKYSPRTCFINCHKCKTPWGTRPWAVSKSTKTHVGWMGKLLLLDTYVFMGVFACWCLFITGSDF